VRWIQVTWPDKGAVFAIATDGGKVTQGPPLVKWAIGESEARVAEWLRDKGATFAPLPDKPQASPHLDPGARFWCPVCHGTQTIAEIQACREAGGS
jgi:hypothetical protein